MFRLAGENPRRSKFLRIGQTEGVGCLRYVAKGVNPRMLSREFPKRKFSSKVIAYGYGVALKTGIVRRQ